MRIKRKGSLQQFSPLRMTPPEDTTQVQDINAFAPDPPNAACHLFCVHNNCLKFHSQNSKMLKENFRKLSKLKEMYSDAQLGRNNSPINYYFPFRNLEGLTIEISLISITRQAVFEEGFFK